MDDRNVGENALVTTDLSSKINTLYVSRILTIKEICIYHFI